MSDCFIQTYKAALVNPLEMRVDDINIEDIAHALALTNRFTGHTPYPYSVAQHSVIVSCLCDDGCKMWGLLHDAPEAYMADISRPVKQYLDKASGGLIKRTENAIMAKVCQKFGLSSFEPDSVKRADNDALANEAFSFFGHTEGYKKWQHRFENGYMRFPKPVIPVTWEQAEKDFLRRFRDLCIIGEE